MIKKSKSSKEKIVEQNNNLNRKEALKRIGFIGVSAATMMLLLNNPVKGQPDGTSPGDPGGGWDL